MIPLEDSTFDLVRRRKVHPHATGCALILALIVLAALLPVIKLEVKTRCPGMIRPLRKPAVITVPFTGILEENRLRDGLFVNKGDTLARISSGVHEARLRTLKRLIADLEREYRDILRIQSGEAPLESPRIIHSFNSHRASISGFRLKRDLALDEYNNAATLYRNEVMPRMEYEKVRSEYMIAETRMTEAGEGYLRELGNELRQIRDNSEQFTEEVFRIEHALREEVIIAPVEGTLLECTGQYLGSVIQGGSPLGLLSPSGNLVAECYVLPDQMAGIRNQAEVLLRFHMSGAARIPVKEARVDYIDKDVTFVKGQPRYVLRCHVIDPVLYLDNGSFRQIRKGMTFTAEVVLERRSAGGLILERINRWMHPLKQQA